jgi:hypothetical protein
MLNRVGPYCAVSSRSWAIRGQDVSDLRSGQARARRVALPDSVAALATERYETRATPAKEVPQAWAIRVRHRIEYAL